jgi:hypothetical protein
MSENDELEQALVHHLKEVVKAIQSQPLHEDVVGIVGGMTTTLLAITSDAPVCSVLVTMSEGVFVMEDIVHPAVPASVLYEMGGRLQAAALRLLATAAHRESDEDADNHTGHGCELDPLRKTPPSDVN